MKCPRCKNAFTLEAGQVIEADPYGSLSAPPADIKTQSYANSPVAGQSELEWVEPLSAFSTTNAQPESRTNPAWVWGLCGAGGTLVACIVAWIILSQSGGNGPAANPNPQPANQVQFPAPVAGPVNPPQQDPQQWAEAMEKRRLESEAQAVKAQQEFAKRQAENEAARVKREAEMAKLQAKRQIDAEAAEAKRKAEIEIQLDGYITTLKDSSKKPTEIRRALSQLSFLRDTSVAQSPRREEIAELMNGFLKSENATEARSALTIVERCGTAVNIPVLMDLMKTTDDRNRSRLVRALGTTGGNEESAALLARFIDTDARTVAATALKQMKNFAEPVVLPLLQASDFSQPNVREVCDILGEVGGKKSRDALTEVLSKSEQRNFNYNYARMALDKIKQRLAANPE